MEFAEWKSPATRILEEGIKTLTYKYINIRSYTITLKGDIVKISLDSIYDNFVVVTIDKANGNIAIVCRCFYT